jgi:hypothetical protein
MPLSQKEIRDRATEFAFRWCSTVREKSESQTFWNEFFDVFGISRRRIAAFEAPVKKLGDKAGSIDLFWKGMLIVEHKSQGQNLDRAYQQALDYFPGISEQELPKYVLVSDFANLRLYDLEADIETDFPLTDLPAQIHRFGFMSGYTKRTYQDEDPVNVQVAEKMGELHDALLAGGYDGHKLEIFLVRLIYCLFADDTGIFPRDHFRFLLEEKTREDGTDTGTLIAQVFQILDTPPEKREKPWTKIWKNFLTSTVHSTKRCCAFPISISGCAVHFWSALPSIGAGSRRPSSAQCSSPLWIRTHAATSAPIILPKGTS